MENVIIQVALMTINKNTTIEPSYKIYTEAQHSSTDRRLYLLLNAIMQV
jgi:hypothetical protein